TWVGRDLFLSVARHDLQVLFERILVSLERIPAARWMNDGRATESLDELVRDLPARIERLDYLAADCGTSN
ncbi:MAG TPA: hypothetical protein VHU91_10665, partial [Mycobacteriales bacterium]|nr:hypothetical protein [Mycobacteriales bacterium]